MSQDSETSIGSNETEIISNTTGEQDTDDSILSTEDLPNRDILTFINSTKVDSTFTEAEEGQPAVTDELATGGNVTEADIQSNEDELQEEGKTITIEELPVQSGESQNEETTEGNVTIKGPLIVNNIKDSNLTTSAELPDEEEQEQTPSLEETTKNESKSKITEVCNDEMDNDLDGIIDEEHECILQTSDIRASNEKVVTELPSLDDKDTDEEKGIEDNHNKNIKDEEND
jgi:hypothetical protein